MYIYAIYTGFYEIINLNISKVFIFNKFHIKVDISKLIKR